MACHPLEGPLTAHPAPLLAIVLGPTGSGKTALSLVLAEHFGGEIVSCDSVAVYREFEVGTAKPSAQDRTRVRHHLLDVIRPADHMTAGEYSRQARTVLQEIQSRNRLPIVVGGTGLYLRALLEGLSPSPPRSDELRKRLRHRAQERGPQYLYRILRRLDHKAAGSIHPNDVPKMVRAIEVCLATGKRMTELWGHGRDPLTGSRILRLGLDPPRDVLYDRLNRRASSMFEAGLIEETQGLLAKYGDTPWALGAMGYKQAVQLIRGEMDRVTAVAAVQQAHRNYAKRQMTWFRREPEVLWMSGFGDFPEIQKKSISHIEGLR